MNDTRQALNELLFTNPDEVMTCLEELAEIDAFQDFFGVLVPASTIDAEQSTQSSKSLMKATKAMMLLRMLVRTAKQNSQPHFYQGGPENDNQAA